MRTSQIIPRKNRFGTISMQYRLSLRSLLMLVGGSALLMMLLAFALQSQQQAFLAKLAFAVLAPAVLFSLYAIAYVLTLPIGLLSSIYQESQEKPMSPFSTDRLPEKIVHVDDRGA